VKTNTKLTIKYYWQEAKKYKVSGIISLLTIITAAVINVIVPLYFKKFFDALTSGGTRGEIASTLLGILFIIALFEFASWVLWRTALVTVPYFQAYVNRDLSNFCFAYLHKHSFGFFQNSFVGSLVKRVNRFVRSFENITDRIFFNFIRLFINIGLIVAILLYRQVWVGLGAIVWIGLYILASTLFVKYKYKYDLERSEADTAATGVLADTITNHGNVKLFNGYEREKQNMASANEHVRKTQLFTWYLGGAAEAVQGFLTIILELGLFYVAIRYWESGLFTVGDFVLIQSYILIIIMQIWDFGRIMQRTYEDLGDAEEMTEILNQPHEIRDIPNAHDLVVKDGQIEFLKVIFNYNETRTILNKLTLKIAPKEKIALVGPSGAGKTTIVKLLLRQHEVADGKILIDGQKISNVTLDSLWANVSLVPQEPMLFHRTLMENIRYGRPEANDKDVIRASKMAHCHEFITGFDQGYDTYVGERGVKLSGGERQRVAIARAILRNAPILVLDEATSSLDSRSESLIQDALNHLMEDKTVIVIAHRLSTIMKMDRILVIAKGKVTEEGTHRELLQKPGGMYRDLWKLQAGGFIE